MPDSRQRLQALESGAADVIQQLAPDDLPLVRLNPDLRLAMAPATLVSYLAMNTQRRPLERSAHPARDRPRRSAGRAGQARLPGARHPRDRPAAAQRVGRPLGRRDLRLRSRRGARSCWPRPAGRAIASRRSSCSRRRPPASTCPTPARVAAIIKRCLGEVGIAVDVILSDPADHQRALWAGEHDLALHGWFNDNGDPDNFLYTLLDSDNTTGSRPSNIAFYSNAWFHDVIGMAQRTTDRTERERLYSQAQAILAIDVPWVPLAHSKVVFAQPRALRGLVVQPSAMGLYRWAEHAP